MPDRLEEARAWAAVLSHLRGEVSGEEASKLVEAYLKTLAPPDASQQAEPPRSTEPMWKAQKDGEEFAPLASLPPDLRDKLKVPKTRFEDEDYTYRSWQGLKGEIIVSRYLRKGGG
jgi:hypothetical protein